MLERDSALVRDLEAVLAPERVLARPIDLVARSVDASIYRMIPQVVVRPRDLDEVRALFAYARAHGRHLTLRTAGTSLSGQAVTDDILVELAPFWKSYRVLDEGRRLWSEPGVVGGYLNRVLAPLGRRLGPDPASIDACMIGGIVANNSSGMCCGVVQNSYHTLDALHFMLADGTVLDTARPDADEDLRRARPDLHAALLALRDEVRADATLAARIRAKFARKQTTAYALNALLDHDTPAQILAHLMVGSQGTLGFVADVTLRTVPEPPHRATALLYFDGAGGGGGGGGAPRGGGRGRPGDHGRGLPALAGRRPRLPVRDRRPHGRPARRVPRRQRRGPGRPGAAGGGVPGRLPPARSRRLHHRSRGARSPLAPAQGAVPVGGRASGRPAPRS